MELAELIETVIDQESFLAFAVALQKDREIAVKEESINPSSPYSSDSRGWENGTIEGFLDAAIAWSQDSNFGCNASEEYSPWRKFAEFLLAGKEYE